MDHEKIAKLAREWYSISNGKVIPEESFLTGKINSFKNKMYCNGVIKYHGCPGCDCWEKEKFFSEIKNVLKIEEEVLIKIFKELKKICCDDCTAFYWAVIVGLYRQFIGQDLALKIHRTRNQRRIESLEEERRLAEYKIVEDIDKIKDLEEALERRVSEVKKNETLIAECFF